jgi:RimJ/RimL family protein N-acetyltransferase
MIEWSTDKEIAQKIFTMPSIWPWISDDTCNLDSFKCPEIDGIKIRLALCYNDKNLCGCFFFMEKSHKATEIHTCLFVHGLAKKFGDEIIEKVFNDTDYESIETFIPIDNPAAKKLAIKCGFSYSGQKDPIIKNGLSVPVEAWELKKCQQQ